jgi:signal transduction histidine kinase/CheY-like chemotaxis protein
MLRINRADERKRKNRQVFARRAESDRIVVRDWLQLQLHICTGPIMTKHLSLRTRFLLLLTFVFLAGSIISALLLQHALQRKAENEVAERAEMLVQTMNAVRSYTSERIQPLLQTQLAERTEFVKESVPAFSARSVFENFRKRPGFETFKYKEATLNPTNRDDLADNFEQALVQQFRTNTSLQSLSGFRDLGDTRLFYTARPLSISKPGCLRCHNTAAEAPKSQITTYGAEHGFGWKLGETVAAQVIYVPAADVLQRGRNYLWLVLSIFSGIFLLAMWLISRQLRAAVIRPLQQLNETADEVAKGNLSTQQLAQFQSLQMQDVAARQDETGALARSFQAMAQEVAKRETNLTNAVAQRTSQLAASMEQARKARGDAEDANKTKSQFLANMSHELRTPLNAIIGYSEMLREEALDTAQDGLVPDIDKITVAGRHLLSLVNDILDLSKIEAGKVELYLESFDLPRELAQVVDTIQPLIRKNGNQLVVECAPELSAQLSNVVSDLTKFRQVLFNILSNAAKFTDKGLIRLVVDVPNSPNVPERFRLRVIDSGIGMNPEQLARMFQTFSQADASTTRKYGGSGLGLAISKHFCTMLGGDISVSSTPGVGSTFTVVLPLRALRPTPPEAVPLPAGAKTVLVIDDDPVVHDLLQRQLSSSGYRVLLAGTGLRGLEIARAERPDVITLDVMMPVMDGWSVLAALKADSALCDIPVVMLSMTSDKQMGYALGASHFLMKPINKIELNKVLQRFLSKGTSALVIEDDQATRELLVRGLSAAGVRVAQAENGRVGMDWLQNHERPDLILLDLMMPVMDGFEFVAELRKNQAFADVPIVVISAKDLSEADRSVLMGGVDRIMSKGALEATDLLKVLNHYIQTSTPVLGDGSKQGDAS